MVTTSNQMVLVTQYTILLLFQKTESNFLMRMIKKILNGSIVMYYIYIFR